MFTAGVLLAFGLYLTRCSVFLIAVPLYGSASPFSGYKIALIGTMSIVFYMVGGEPIELTGSPFEYLLLMAREALIGYFLAFILQIILVVIRVAGELIGQGMGLGMSSTVDPVTGINTPVITRLYEALFYIGFLMMDGHHGLLRSLGKTFERAPIGKADFEAPMPEFIGDLFAQLFNIGLTFAAPVLITLSLVTLLMGLLARAVPQPNILELSFTLRVAFALLTLLVFAPTLGPGLGVLFEKLDTALEGSLIVIGGDRG